MSKKTLMQLTIIAFYNCAVGKDKLSAVTCKELFASLDPADQGRFNNGADSMSKELSTLKRDGFVINGESVYINNKAHFTWYMSSTWPYSLDVFNDMPLPGAVGNAVIDGAEKIKDVFDDASWSGLEPDKFKDFLDNAGCINDVPDMVKVEFDYDHNGVTIPVQFYFSAEIPASPSPIYLANKKEKLAVLQYVKKLMGVINTDFELVISDIILDLNQVAEAD